MTLLPPPEYAITPSIPVIEEVLPWNEVQINCMARSNELVLLGWYQGCAFIVNKKCYIYRINDENIRVHELAHCAGWPKDHPNAIEARDETDQVKNAIKLTVPAKPLKIPLR